MFKRYLRNIIPILLGALGGFLYYNFIGCYTGACPITGNPYVSTLYGVLIGFTFTDFFNFNKKGKKNEN